MIKKLLPVLLFLIGTGAGVGAGVFLRPPPEPVDAAQTDGEATAPEPIEHGAVADRPSSDDRAYVKMSNQFVVPVVRGQTIEALVVMSLSLEVIDGKQEGIYSREPKLRNAFLQVLFDHANIGGFAGAFTEANNLLVLRNSLLEVAHKTVGEEVLDVLIQEIARQDY